jgi:cell filamentation protein
VIDPYCWPENDCLLNKLGIRDPEKLRRVEARIVAVRDVQIATATIPGEYGLEHLKEFHGRLFGDVYEWAGATRTVDISKPGAKFCHWRYVDEQIDAVLSELGQEGCLIGFAQRHFVERLAHYYGEINAVHPFREGNGRTQRAFLRQLAAAAGWRLNWSALDRATHEGACRANLHTGEAKPLIEVLTPVVARI